MSSRHRAQVRPCSAAEKRSLFFTLPGEHRSLPPPQHAAVVRSIDVIAAWLNPLAGELLSRRYPAEDAGVYVLPAA